MLDWEISSDVDVDGEVLGKCTNPKGSHILSLRVSMQLPSVPYSVSISLRRNELVSTKVQLRALVSYVHCLHERLAWDVRWRY